MKRKALFIFAIFAASLLAACGQGENQDNGNAEAENSLEPLEVEILTESDAFEPGDEGTIEILVTQGEEKVSDAKEVVFEVWKKGEKDNSEEFEADNNGDGNYSFTYNFEEEAVYHVIPHVTARNMHSMPEEQFPVGDVEVVEEDESEEENMEEGHHE